MRKAGTVLVLFLWMFLVILGAGGASHAQEFMIDFKAPMPKIELMPQEEFEKKTALHDVKVAGDEALSYTFRLPKDWKKPNEDPSLQTYSLSNKILNELTRFYGPPVLDTRSYFSVQALNLEFKLAAKDWLLKHLLENGYSIQGLAGYGDDRAEALYVYINNDISYVVRIAAQINGRRIVLAQYYMPTDNWDNEKQMQAQVISTFALTHPVKEAVEEMQIYHFLDISEFRYPVSWEFKSAPLKSADRMSFQLLKVASEKVRYKTKYKTLDGKLQVDIVSYFATESLEKEKKSFMEGLSKIGLIIGDPIETHDDTKFQTGVKPAKTEVFKAMDSDDKLLSYEFWTTVLEAGDYYYFVSLITPSRDADFGVWLRNVQTYKLVIEEFKPLEDSITNR